ncbi:MAG: serine/threonine-protein phosphatase, partial [Phycisphaerales bacterium]|nr:serine/threonine-protein phosphatase [Phycisphaerales bacterium]
NVLEITRLAVAQDKMRDAVQTLLRLEQDLRVARSIQQATFPDTLPSIDGFEFAAWSEPADETGGDTYDAVALRDLGLDDRRVAFFLADATGHGVGPALSVMQGRAMLRMALRQGLRLEETLHLMNRQLVEDLATGRFVTAWLGMLDPRTRTLHARSAGQGPILWWHQGRLETFPADVPPLGVIDDLNFEGTGKIILEPGDVVLVLSDGIFERFNPDGEQFGVARVEAVMRSHGSSSASRLAAALRQEVDAFAQGIPAGDDQTGVIVRVR